MRTAAILGALLLGIGTSTTPAWAAGSSDAKAAQPEKKQAPTRNSSGPGGLGGMSTSGAGTGGMTTEPGDGASTSKPKATDKSSRPASKDEGAPQVPDAKNKEKRRWE